MNKQSINIIIPTYNSSKSIGILKEEIFNVLKGEDFHIIFVDDASKDETQSIIASMAKENDNIKYEFLRENRGQQEAVRKGLWLIRKDCDLIVTMDDDMQNPAFVIKNLIDEINKGFDMVYAISERDLKQLQIHPPIYRRIGSKLRDALFSSFLNKPLNIRVSAFRIITYELACRIRASEKEFFYLSAEAFSYKIKVANIYYPYVKRHSGESSYNLLKLSKLYLKIIYYYKIKGK